MASNSVSFFLALAFVVIAFILKAGLFNDELADHDRIGRMHAFSEFPIDGTMAAFPVLMIAVVPQIENYLWLLLGFPASIIFVIVQIHCFKSTKRRSASPGTTCDVFFVPLNFLISYGLFASIAYTTYLVAEGALS